MRNLHFNKSKCVQNVGRDKTVNHFCLYNKQSLLKIPFRAFGNFGFRVVAVARTTTQLLNIESVFLSHFSRFEPAVPLGAGLLLRALAAESRLVGTRLARAAIVTCATFAFAAAAQFGCLARAAVHDVEIWLRFLRRRLSGQYY